MCMEAPIRLASETTDCRFPGVHRSVQRERAAIIGQLKTSADDKLRKRAGKIAECASWPTIRRKADGSPLLCLGRCKDRLCPLCSRLRGAECTSRITALVMRMRSPRFLTLTVKNSDGDLGAQINRLFACFRDFRRRESWKDHVRGGCYSLEVTFNRKDGTWHPHLHLIIDGEYWTQKEISGEWLQCTGDSSIVHIEKVHDAQRTAKYISGYVNTPPDISGWPANKACEYAVALHGRRVLHSFGCCHGRVVDEDPETAEKQTTVHVCGVALLRRRASGGCVHASKALRLMERMGGFWAQVASPGAVVPRGEKIEITPTDMAEFLSACESAALDDECSVADTPKRVRVDRPPDPMLISIERDRERSRKR